MGSKHGNRLLDDLMKYSQSEEIAIIYDNGVYDESITYVHLLSLVDKLQEEMNRKIEHKGGTDKQMCGAFFGSPSIKGIAIFLSCLRLNYIFVPISSKARKSSHFEIVKRYNIKHCLVEKNMLQIFLDALKFIDIKVKEIRTLRAMQMDYVLVILLMDSFLALTLDRSCAYIVQSSGTTGTPKTIIVPDSCITPNITDLRYVVLFSPCLCRHCFTRNISSLP